MMVQNDSDSEDEDEVFKLARKDHELSDEDSEQDFLPVVDASSGPSISKGVATPTAITGPAVGLDENPKVADEDLSKRKLKSLTSKRGLLKTRPTAEKTIFDESGNITTFYQAGIDAERGAVDRERRAEYVTGEQERMKDATRVDREVAREIRRERKRKRKEREREVSATSNEQRATSAGSRSRFEEFEHIDEEVELTTDLGETGS